MFYTTPVVVAQYTYQLTGTIPTEIGLLGGFLASVEVTIGKRRHLQENSGLERLHLADNPGLTGTIPTELALVTTLVSFTFDGTDLEGEIPEDICDIEDLELDCSEEVCGCDCDCQEPTMAPTHEPTTLAPSPCPTFKCVDCDVLSASSDSKSPVMLLVLVWKCKYQ